MRPARLDLAIAAFFVVAQQLEVWIWWDAGEQGPRPFAAVMGLLIALPLLWRRRAPVAALVAAMVVLLAWALISAPRGSLWPLLTSLALTFSVAAHAGWRPAAAAGALCFGVWLVFVATTTNSIGDYGFIEAFVVAAWVAGRAIRTRQQRADELLGETVRLEGERAAAAERERARIARELHDIISHSVSVMVVQAGAAEQVLQADPEQAAASLRAIQEAGRSARVELRRLLGLMRGGEGAELEPQPGLQELPALVAQLRSSGLEVELDADAGPLPGGLDVAVYRIVQEALTNALKHGGPGRARVAVRRGRDALDVEVVNASGDVAANGDGFGLVGMGERVAFYGGRLEHGRGPDGAYRVHARLPL